jgi:cytochrome d ubiquinol oxidase subunit II
MTWATVFVLPLVLLYQGWTYWVFRRRITAAPVAAPAPAAGATGTPAAAAPDAPQMTQTAHPTDTVTGGE